MKANHDDGEPTAAQQKSREYAALADGRRRETADYFGTPSADGLQKENGGGSGDEEDEERCQKEIKELGNKTVEPSLQPSPGAGDEQYRDNAAASGNERFAPQRDGGELGVADQRR